MAVWQAPGTDGEKHQGLAPNLAILGVQVEMPLQCLHRSAALGKGFLATVRVDAQEHVGRKTVSPGRAPSTPPLRAWGQHRGPCQTGVSHTGPQPQRILHVVQPLTETGVEGQR